MPQQMDVGQAKNKGPKLLKEYLEYAWQVSQQKYNSQPLPYSQRSTSWFLAQKLKAWTDQAVEGYVASREFPFADLTVKNEDNHYIGLVNTDDDLYYQSESAKDMHAYRPAHLALKNWKFKNIYSRQFWQQRESIEEQLNRFIKTDGEKS